MMENVQSIILERRGTEDVEIIEIARVRNKVIVTRTKILAT